ncbi:MAG TPA: hypothetical protein VFR02_06525 [bacterium]|nr:hypothetical protein [bacterium]
MNRTSPIHTPPGGPQGRPPSPEIYMKMGQENIFRMLADFYHELGRSQIRGMFPEDLEAASRKSALFFTTLLGGPPLYAQTYGPPRMRARHLPFEIDEGARRIWLDCFDRVLRDAPARYAFPPEHLEDFRRFLADFSAWMVNKA